MTHSAIISECRQFRYLLRRGSEPRCAVVLLNPSKADGEKDDPTSRKLLEFARLWGFQGYDLFNVGAGRATDPRDWLSMSDPQGPLNDLFLCMAATYPVIVVGWGNNAPVEAASRTLKLLRLFNRPIFSLGLNASGAPKHPLYVPYSALLRPYEL